MSFWENSGTSSGAQGEKVPDGMPPPTSILTSSGGPAVVFSDAALAGNSVDGVSLVYGDTDVVPTCTAAISASVSRTGSLFDCTASQWMV